MACNSHNFGRDALAEFKFFNLETLPFCLSFFLVHKLVFSPSSPPFHWFLKSDMYVQMKESSGKKLKKPGKNRRGQFLIRIIFSTLCAALVNYKFDYFPILIPLILLIRLRKLFLNSFCLCLLFLVIRIERGQYTLFAFTAHFALCHGRNFLCLLSGQSNLCNDVVFEVKNIQKVKFL